MSKPKVDGLKAGYDSQLKTPKHDQLCLDYCKKENDQIILDSIPYLKIKKTQIQESFSNTLNLYLNNIKKEDYSFNIIKETLIEKTEYKYEKNKYILKGKFIKRKVFETLNKTKDNIEIKHHWEYPIKSRNFLIGVIDFQTNIKLIKINLLDQITEIYESKIIEFEYKRYEEDKIDLNLNTDYESNYKELAKKQKYKIQTVNKKSVQRVQEQLLEQIYSEIKPKIDSIGEVMRQLKIYLSYIGINLSYYNKNGNKINTSKNNIMLVTYGEDYRNLFEEQGFIYLNLGQEPKNKNLITSWSDLE